MKNSFINPSHCTCDNTGWMLVLSALLSPSSTCAVELLMVGIAGICHSPSLAVFSPSSTGLSVLHDLLKIISINSRLAGSRFSFDHGYSIINNTLINPLTPKPAVTGRAKTHPQFPVPAITSREKACEDNCLSYPP